MANCSCEEEDPCHWVKELRLVDLRDEVRDAKGEVCAGGCAAD
jgi:hypothetical protein